MVDAEKLTEFVDNYFILYGIDDDCYATLMTRGIHGAFVYVCDPALREYLRPYLQSY